MRCPVLIYRMLLYQLRHRCSVLGISLRCLPMLSCYAIFLRYLAMLYSCAIFLRHLPTLSAYAPAVLHPVLIIWSYAMSGTYLRCKEYQEDRSVPEAPVLSVWSYAMPGTNLRCKHYQEDRSVPASGPPPGARVRPEMVAVPGTLYLYGGVGYTDVYEYDVVERRWLDITSGSDAVPLGPSTLSVRDSVARYLWDLASSEIALLGTPGTYFQKQDAARSGNVRDLVLGTSAT
eukprot:700195-Rhodomonas_salina.1